MVGIAAKQPPGHGLNTVLELCFIGLAAYFEAFCKDQFSAIVNIMPQTLVRFTNARECTLAVKNLLPIINNISGRLGFLLAEEYDFGTGKSVNSLFADLVNVTPFSKTELAEYSEFLRDRNLLVHHGGVFTTKYASQLPVALEYEGNVHFNSLVIDKTDIEKWSAFLLGIAKKLGQASSKAVMQLAEKSSITLDAETLGSVKALKW